MYTRSQSRKFPVSEEWNSLRGTIPEYETGTNSAKFVSEIGPTGDRIRDLVI